MTRLVFQTVSLDEPIGPVSLAVDDHFVKGFAFAVDDWSALYFTAPGRCGPFAHSPALAKKLLHLFAERYDPQGIRSVHLKEDIWFEAPVPFDETVALSGRYTDKFKKKGRPIVVFESEARDRQGRLLVRQRSMEIVPSDGPISAEWEREGGSAETLLSSRRVSAVLPTGVHNERDAGPAPDTVLPVLSKTIHQDQISLFCGADENWKNLHTDPDIAREAGFETTIMSGMIQTCWFTEMLVSFFGPSFLSGGRLGTTFLAPVACGETIDCYGVVRKVSETGGVEVELWSLNGSGIVTCGGWAIIPSAIAS